MRTRIFGFALIILLAASGAWAQTEAPEAFVTLFNETVPEFDPHRSIYSSEAQIFTALYEGLVSYDPATLEPVPGAAASWKKSKDGKVYTFTLREGLRWSDGSRLVAADFRNTWLRLLGMNAQYAAFFDVVTGAADYRLKKNADPSSVGIAALDDRTLVVTLNRPVAYFTRLLCHHAFSPAHPSMLKADDWAGRIPFPVNGPYRFVSMAADTLVLERNPEYWDAASVAIPKLEFLFTDDDDTATLLFNGEEAHWLAGPGNYDEILLSSAIQLNPIFATSYWYFDCSEAPWNNAAVRRALALLLPWKEIRDESRYQAPATTLVLPLPGYSKAKGIESPDRDEALKLLAQAGFPEGAGLPPMNIYYADGKDAMRIAALMQAAWKALPTLKVNLMPISGGRYYGTVAGPDRQPGITIAHSTWIGDFADPEAFLQMWMPDSPLNDARFSDPAFSAAIAKSYDAEGKERMALLAEAETYLLQNAVVLPIYHSFAGSVIDSDYIEGWYQNALDIHPYKYLKFGTPSIGPNVAKAGTPADARF